MKRIKSGVGANVFLLNPNEKLLLMEIMRLYPQVPETHHSLTKDTQDAKLAEAQKLLEEAVAEQRRENQERLQKFLQLPGTFKNYFKNKKGYFSLTLTDAELEWLLQVLNDIRIGCWIKLGSPDEQVIPNLALNEKTSPLMHAMDFCSYFQYALLKD